MKFKIKFVLFDYRTYILHTFGMCDLSTNGFPYQFNLCFGNFYKNKIAFDTFNYCFWLQSYSVSICNYLHIFLFHLYCALKCMFFLGDNIVCLRASCNCSVNLTTQMLIRAKTLLQPNIGSCRLVCFFFFRY